MKMTRFLAAVLFGGLLISVPMKAMAEEETSADDPAPGIVMFAAPMDNDAGSDVSYCYIGSAMDSSTGQIVDLYTTCTAGATDQELAD